MIRNYHKYLNAIIKIDNLTTRLQSELNDEARKDICYAIADIRIAMDIYEYDRSLEVAIMRGGKLSIVPEGDKWYALLTYKVEEVARGIDDGIEEAIQDLRDILLRR